CAAANSAASATGEQPVTCAASARTPQALAELQKRGAATRPPTTTSAGDGPGRWRAGPATLARAATPGAAGSRAPGRAAANPPPGAFRRHPCRRNPADGPPHHLLEPLPARRPRARHATDTRNLARSAGTTPRHRKRRRTLTKASDASRQANRPPGNAPHQAPANARKAEIAIREPKNDLRPSA